MNGAAPYTPDSRRGYQGPGGAASMLAVSLARTSEFAVSPLIMMVSDDLGRVARGLASTCDRQCSRIRLELLHRVHPHASRQVAVAGKVGHSVAQHGMHTHGDGTMHLALVARVELVHL